MVYNFMQKNYFSVDFIKFLITYNFNMCQLCDAHDVRFFKPFTDQKMCVLK